jgi:hypothetical protein
MKKLVLIALITLFCVQSYAAAGRPSWESVYANFSQRNYQNFSYLSPDYPCLDSPKNENEGFSLLEVPNVNGYESIVAVDSGQQKLFYIAEELSPVVERYAFDDNATTSQLYFGVSSALISYAVRKATDNQFDLRLHEDINEDNKSKYSVELAFRPVSYIGLNFLVPNGEYMFGLSFYPSDSTVLSFIINDNETATVTGFNINTVF